MLQVDPHIGSELAGYRLEALLGRGRNAIAYLAEDVRLNRHVTLELLSPELGTDEQFREQFLRESRLATLLDHPGIVPVYEAGEVDGRLYVARAQVEGTDLASLLVQEGRLEPERALAVVAELADALDAARWGRGLVHGNLGPAEVLVAGERVLLTGFGERRELPTGAGLGEAARHFGTGGYPAPEQIQGRPVSPRSDIYALGCLLVECLTGAPPFAGRSSEALLRAHLNDPPPSVTGYGLPAGIDRVIGKALAKWPEERYSTCTELAAAAQAALAGRAQPEQARLLAVGSSAQPGPVFQETPSSDVAESDPSSPPSTLVQRLRASRRTVAAAIGLTALVGLAAGAIWLVGRDADEARSAGPEPAAAQTLGEVAVEAGAAAPAPSLDDAEARRQPSYRQFSAWLEAFNSGDRDTYMAFLEEQFPNRFLWGVPGDPDAATDEDMSLRELTGGFELPKLEEVSVDRISGRLQERNSLEPYQFLLGVAPTEPHKILYLLLEPIGEPAESPTNGLSEPVLSRVPGSLVRVDARTGQILARLAIPSPKFLASDGRSVWVFSDDESGDRLVRIDAATNTVTDSFNADVSAAGGEAATEPSVPNQLAVAGGSAWLSVDWGHFYRFTPGANAGEAAQIEAPSPWFQLPFAAAGSLGSETVREAEVSGEWIRVAGRILADLAPIQQVVAAGPGFVWALDDAWGPNPGLVRIDTETNAVAPLGDAPRSEWLDFAVADGALWASSKQSGTIVRLDPVTGEVEGEVDVVPSPGPIAAGGGAVWAASRDTTIAYPSSSNRTVARYDIATGRVQRIVVGGTPSDLVFARGSVWVAVREQLYNDGSPTEDLGVLGTDRLTLTVDRVPFSFSLQAGDSWERFGSTSINKNTVGGQAAEAIIFWQTLRSDENTNRCAPLVGASLADLAATAASAPGTELVTGPSDVTVGGRAAKHVVLTVREDVGCDPGFFFTWPAVDNAAMWLETMQGDTIRVWIVDVDGTHFVIEAETRSEVGSDLDQEIQQFVESIRFEGA